MARITFKGKVRDVYEADGKAVAWRYTQVPEFSRPHCDMNAFRSHKLYGGLANSDLFKNVLGRIRREKFGKLDPVILRLDRVPAGVSVDTSGFLAVVSFEV